MRLEVLHTRMPVPSGTDARAGLRKTPRPLARLLTTLGARALQSWVIFTKVQNIAVVLI